MSHSLSLFPPFFPRLKTRYVDTPDFEVDGYALERGKSRPQVSTLGVLLPACVLADGQTLLSLFVPALCREGEVLWWGAEEEGRVDTKSPPASLTSSPLTP